jgi:serine/threonine-protein kinase
MASGMLPFTGRSLPELLGSMLAGQARDPRDLQPELPAAASACLLRCLDRDPTARFATVGELRRAWRAVAAP